MDNAVVEAKAVPPVATLYHFGKVPVATKLETVAEVQNVCDAAVGAEGVAVPEPVAKVIVVVPVPL